MGRSAALELLIEAVGPLADKARAECIVLQGFGFGLTGLDRPKDRDVLDGVTSDFISWLSGRAECADDPFKAMVNDAELVLRAGTDDGIGVAVSSGTGGNCVGRGRDGRGIQVGGLANELGDGGGAYDIARAGLRAAGRARDGRGWKTLISDLVVESLGLDCITDIMDFMIPGDEPGDGNDMSKPNLIEALGSLAPLVFRAAAEGDLVARGILSDMGADLGLAASIAGTRLGFGPDEAFPLVLGGSVLMNAEDATFEESIVAEARKRFENIQPVKLRHHPVLGAVLLAMDGLAGDPKWGSLSRLLDDGTLRKRIGEQLVSSR